MGTLYYHGNSYKPKIIKLLLNVRSRGKKIGKKQTRMLIVDDSWILGFKVMVIFFFLVYKFSVYTTMTTMASPTRGTRVWANSRSWSWIGKPGVLQSMGLQSWTRLSDWTELILQRTDVTFITWTESRGPMETTCSGSSGGRAVPCDNSARRRRSAGRSVWSPARWGAAARWCSRTAPLYWRTPWWSQSYLCSQTLRGEQRHTNSQFNRQAHLGLDSTVERGDGGDVTAQGADQSGHQRDEERGKLPSQVDNDIIAALTGLALLTLQDNCLSSEDPTHFTRFISHKPLPLLHLPSWWDDGE